jgi:gamma-glutamylcyclotransferase (GGCT)/AIG2-like uncharacterized protein YtfP
MLYFVYTARLAPDRLRTVAPSAAFEFVAHLDGAAVSFSVAGNGWGGGIPTVVRSPGSTVWGAVFTIPETEARALDHAEAAEGRAREDMEVIDRLGRRHRVAAHRAVEPAGPELPPAIGYLDFMLAGARHWELPIGWIVGLDDRRNAMAETPGVK